MNVDTEFNFYAISTVSGASNPVQKLIKLTVANCLVLNCQVCSSSSTSICTTWNSGYNLNSGVWNIQKSEVLASTTSQSLGSTLSGIVGSTFVITTITSLMNSTTMASVWTMINQMQMLHDFENIITLSFIKSNIFIINFKLIYFNYILYNFLFLKICDL